MKNSANYRSELEILGEVEDWFFIPIEGWPQREVLMLKWERATMIQGGFDDIYDL